MHTVARFFVNWLWQEGGCFALLSRHIFDNVFNDHGIVRHCRHIRQFYFYFHLARSAYLMMVVFYLDSPVLHHHTHAASQIISYILGRRHMVAAFVRHFIAVISRRVKTAVPVRLFGVDPVSALMRAYLITGAVKKIKFKFRSDYHPVCNSTFLHILHCPQAYIFGILVKGFVFPFSDSTNIAAHGQRGDCSERIHISGIRIR